MKKKYTIKKKTKTISVLYIFIIIFIILMTISIGYSKFSSQLNLIGNISLDRKISSNSTLNVNVNSNWTSENIYYYNMNLKLINLDEEVSEWEVVIDFPSGVNIQKSQFWCAAEVKVENIGNYSRVIFKNYDWNANKPLNSEIDFGFNIAFSEYVEIKVENVTFNGKPIKEIVYGGNVT